MKILLCFLFVILFTGVSDASERTLKGDTAVEHFVESSNMYVDGNFAAWNHNCDNDENYEVKQHVIWTDEELEQIMKKSDFINEEQDAFLKAYRTNLTDEYYIRQNGKKFHNSNQIDMSASVFELYYTCVAINIKKAKCKSLYLEAYENYIKKVNEQSAADYQVYGSLNLPITTVVWQMFQRTSSLCQPGKDTPEMDYSSVTPVKIKATDSVATCSYLEDTDMYKCILNRFYNTAYRCTVSCQGKFNKQGEDLIYEGECSDQRIIPKSRPSLLDFYMSDEFNGIMYK